MCNSLSAFERAQQVSFFFEEMLHYFEEHQSSEKFAAAPAVSLQQFEGAPQLHSLVLTRMSTLISHRAFEASVQASC